MLTSGADGPGADGRPVRVGVRVGVGVGVGRGVGWVGVGFAVVGEGAVTEGLGAGFSDRAAKAQMAPAAKPIRPATTIAPITHPRMDRFGGGPYGL